MARGAQPTKVSQETAGLKDVLVGYNPNKLPLISSLVVYYREANATAKNNFLHNVRKQTRGRWLAGVNCVKE